MSDKTEKIAVEEVQFLPKDVLDERSPKDPEKGRAVDDDAFQGLSKEELEQFADDPFWVRTRKILLLSFGVVWVGMIVTAIVIVVLSPKCPARPDQKWWETSAVYRLDVRTFFDSDGDGTGDLEGLVKKLGYIQNLGIGAISLRSIFPTGGKDALKRDVKDFEGVDAEIGDLESLQTFVKAVHKIGLKVILEMDPNHSSQEHPFFVESRKKSGARANYYVWRPSKPETTWKTLDDDSKDAWSEDATRKEFYYHANGAELPDLNYREEAVKRWLINSLEYWLVHEQIDGFFLNRPELWIEDDRLAANNSDGWVHQAASVDLVADIRAKFDAVSAATGKDRALIVRVGRGGEDQRGIFYGREKTAPAAHVVVNDDLFVHAMKNAHVDCPGGALATCVNGVVERSIDKIVGKSLQAAGNGGRRWYNWALSSLKSGRIASNVDVKFVDAFNMLALTLPGTPFTLYGDELGMKDGADASSPLKALSVMQWDADVATAGFTTAAEAAYPVNLDAKTINVKFQTARGNAEESHLNSFATLVKLRGENSFAYGEFRTLTNDGKLFTFLRSAEGHPAYFVAINFGNEPGTVPGKGFASVGDVSDQCRVVATTPGVHPEFAIKTVLDPKRSHFLLQAGDGVVVNLGRR